MKFKVLLAGVILVACTGFVHADDDLFIYNIREKAMGGAGVASVTGPHSLNRNPAGLANSRFDIKFLKIGVGLGDEGISQFSKLTDFKDAKGSDKFDKALALSPSKFGLEFNSSPLLSFVNTGFGVGVFTGGQVLGEFYNGVNGPELNLKGGIDFTPVLGIGNKAQWFGKDVNWGLGVRYLSRSRVINSSTGETTFKKNVSDFSGNDPKIDVTYATASGIAFDTGLQIPNGEGMWGVALRNIGGDLKGDYKVTGNVKKDYSEKLPLDLRVGYATPLDFRAVPFVGGIVGKLDSAIDYRFASGAIFKNLYMGVEKKIIGDFLKVQMGLSQGYPTVGTSLDLILLKFNYAYSVEEKGNQIGDDPYPAHYAELSILF